MRNLRDLDHPVWRRAVRGLSEFNAAHPWSHNDHYHGWILRRLPQRRRRALDVGCGRGLLLSRLAARFEEVVGTDLDPQMRAASRERCAPWPNVTVADTPLDRVCGPFDLVTMVAVLHHVDEATALGQVRDLLAPGGRLLVVGLAPPVTAVDQVWDLASALANPAMGLIKHPRRVGTPVDAAPFPVRDPETPVDELRALAARVLPGATVRRRLFFRHTLEWTAPLDPSGAEQEVSDPAT